MSSEGLPVDGVVGTDIVLNARSTQQATDEAKSSLSADSAAQSADAAFKFSREAKTVTVVASDAADRAEAAADADNAQNIADANTYYTSATDPDGTITGLAGTPDGKSFRVAIQDATLSVVAFNYYLNKGGVAEFITSYPNKRYIDMVNALADSTDRRTRGLLTLKRKKKPVDFVSRQGASMFSINENSEKEMPGKTFSDYMNILRELIIGPSALRRARPGYLFNIIVGGFRLLAVRDDGVGTMEYRGIPLENHIGLLQNTLGGFGDSLSDNGRNPPVEPGKPRGWTFNARSWQMWASLFSDGRIKYIGQWATGGYTTADMIRDHLKSAIAAKPRFITFLGGRNDVIQTNNDGTFKFSLSVIKNNIKYILTEFRKNGIIPVVCSMAAQNNSDPALKNRENEINAFLRAYATNQGLSFVDMRAVTVDPVTDGWRAGYNGKLPDGEPDPSHPAPLGAFHMGKALEEALAPFTMPVYPQLAIANPVTEGGANAIINPLFLDVAGDTPAGWTVEGGSVAITTDPAVVGNVLVVTGIGTMIPRVSQTAAVIPGETRTFSFRVKTDVTIDNSTACYCEANDGFNTNIAGIRTWRHSTDGFVTFSYDVVIPTGVTEVKVIIAANAGQISVGQIGLIKVEIV